MLSVIIVNHNTRRLTAALISSLREHIRSNPMDICVVDNDSTDGSARYIARLFPDVDLIESPVNLGFGRAVNLAAGRRRGRYLWLLNSDCLVGADIAAEMIAYLERHPDAAAATGRLVSDDGSFQASCRRFPSFWNLFLSRKSPFSSLIRWRADYTLPDYDVPTPVEACACTNIMIRREHFERVGGFDERFFMYCEDTDLCRRFAARGLKVVYLPRAQVMHLWAGSWRPRDWMRYYHHHRSMIRYLRKHSPEGGMRLELMELLLIVGLGVRMAGLLLRRPG